MNIILRSEDQPTQIFCLDEIYSLIEKLEEINKIDFDKIDIEVDESRITELMKKLLQLNNKIIFKKEVVDEK